MKSDAQHLPTVPASRTQVTRYRTIYARFFPSSYFEQMTEGEQNQIGQFASLSST